MNLRPGAKNNAQSSTNRSDEVRRRRTQRSQERITSVSNRVVNNPVKKRPVTVRGNTFGTPLHRQVGTRAPRRQFYLTMDQAAGTELRLPAIRLVNPGWRLLSGLIFILAAVSAFSMWNSPFFQIQSVEVLGLQRLSADEVNALLRLENLATIEIDPSEIKDLVIQTYPDLINVHVRVQMPNIVSVSAQERQPILAFQSGDQITWADAEGVLFTARGDAGPLLTIYTDGDLPLAPVLPDISQLAATQETAGEETEATAQPTANLNAPQRIDPVLFEAVQGLNQKLPPETQLIYSAQEGLGWTDPNGWQVYIGRDLSLFEAKYLMYQGIASHLSDQELHPSMVSVEHLNAPYYRLEQ
jgi:cell division protein FtsQ